MATSLNDFFEQVTARLAALPQVEQLYREELASGDPARALRAALKAIEFLASPVRVILDVNPVTANPECTADRPVHAAVLYSGADLADLAEDDLFWLGEGTFRRQLAGFRQSAMIDRAAVSRTFAAVDAHLAAAVWRANARRLDAYARRFRVEWLEGYVEGTAAQEHELDWFDPVHDRGFDVECAMALLVLDVGEYHDEIDVTTRTRITRIA